jgi:hypothetical protein
MSENSTAADTDYAPSPPPPHPYNTNIKIEYSNTRDYRAALRSAFYMVCDLDHLIEENPDYDEETLDEELYDEEHVKQGLDYIYEKTKNIPVFRSLYSSAAARILSENLDLGMTILFSYDHFKLFHECLVKFLNDGVLYEDDEVVKNLEKNI